MTATLEFVRASRWYGQVIALNDVTTAIGPGVTGLLGPNGAGKSTFLKLAAGQLAPSQGEVKMLGKPAWGSPELFHRVGLCPEADAFWEQLTGLQFLIGLLRLTGYDEAECRQRAENALHEVALLDAKDRKIGGYSKGMRQRVKLAQTLAHPLHVILHEFVPVGMILLANLLRRFPSEVRRADAGLGIVSLVDARHLRHRRTRDPELAGERLARHDPRRQEAPTAEDRTHPHGRRL